MDSEPVPQVRKDAPGQAQTRGNDAKRVNKRSVDYVLRSGFAGGMAGCAVSFLLYGLLMEGREERRLTGYMCNRQKR